MTAKRPPQAGRPTCCSRLGRSLADLGTGGCAGRAWPHPLGGGAEENPSSDAPAKGLSPDPEIKTYGALFLRYVASKYVKITFPIFLRAFKVIFKVFLPQKSFWRFHGGPGVPTGVDLTGFSFPNLEALSSKFKSNHFTT